MDETRDETWMIRYECCACDMQATVVSTTASRTAWIRHMATHADIDDYRSWTWAVVPLPLV